MKVGLLEWSKVDPVDLLAAKTTREVVLVGTCDEPGCSNPRHQTSEYWPDHIVDRHHTREPACLSSADLDPVGPIHGDHQAADAKL